MTEVDLGLYMQRKLQAVLKSAGSSRLGSGPKSSTDLSAQLYGSPPTAKPKFTLRVGSLLPALPPADDEPQDAAAVTAELLAATGKPQSLAPTYQSAAVDTEFHQKDGCALPTANPGRDKYSALSRTSQRSAEFHGLISSQSNASSSSNSGFRPSSRLASAPVEQCLTSGEQPGDARLGEEPVPDDANEDMGSMAGWQAVAAQMVADGEIGDDEVGSNVPECGSYVSSQGDLQHVGSTSQSDSSPESTLAARCRASLASHKSVDVQVKAGAAFYVKYDLEDRLGAGAFGEAWRVRRRKDGQMCVVKAMNTNNMNKRAEEEALNEVRVLAGLRHPNVVRYYESFDKTFINGKDRVMIVMELCDEGDLDSWVKKQGGKYLSEEAIMMVFVQICLGLQYIHSQGVIHRDLKVNNVFCCTNGVVKIGDFGISKALGEDEFSVGTMVGTPYYMSPDILQGRKYDHKTDVWALGCILYELCALKRAFDAANMGFITVKIISGKYAPIPVHYSSDMKQLVEALIKIKPEDRPEISDILELQFVREHLIAYDLHVRAHVANERKASIFRSLLPYMSGTSQLDLVTEEGPLQPASTLSMGTAMAEEAERQAQAKAAFDRHCENEQLQKVLAQAYLQTARQQEHADARAKLRAFKTALQERKQSWRIGHSDPGGRRSGNGNGAHEALTSSCSLPEPLISYGSMPAPVSALTSPAATGPKSRLFNASGTASKRGSSWAGDLVQQDSSLPFIQVDSNALRVSMNGSEGLLQDIQEILQRPARTSLAGQAEGVVL